MILRLKSVVEWAEVAFVELKELIVVGKPDGAARLGGKWPETAVAIIEALAELKERRDEETALILEMYPGTEPEGIGELVEAILDVEDEPASVVDDV